MPNVTIYVSDKIFRELEGVAGTVGKRPGEILGEAARRGAAEIVAAAQSGSLAPALMSSETRLAALEKAVEEIRSECKTLYQLTSGVEE